MNPVDAAVEMVDGVGDGVSACLSFNVSTRLQKSLQTVNILLYVVFLVLTWVVLSLVSTMRVPGDLKALIPYNATLADMDAGLLAPGERVSACRCR